MTLKVRLSIALGPFPTERKHMFGGLMARVSKDTYVQALKIPGASTQGHQA